MTVHGHHAAWQGDMMHGEVNMINSNAALDGGRRNSVSGAHAQGTLTHTVCLWSVVCLSALDTGDFSRVGSASDCEPCFRFGTVAQVLSTVVIATRSTIKLGTQRNVPSAAIEVA